MTVKKRVERAMKDLSKANRRLLRECTKERYFQAEKARQEIDGVYFNLKCSEYSEVLEYEC